VELRAVVDRERCVGNGVCLEAAPGAFRLDAEGRAESVEAGARTGMELREAARACPTGAILLFDMRTRSQVRP
jgi:ferredoxin